MNCRSAITAIMAVSSWLCCNVVNAQQSDTTAAPLAVAADSNVVVIPESTHSVKKAVRYSMVLPGLGQAYNRKYWKMPIIYGLGGFTAFTAVRNGREYIRYRDAYRIRVDGDPATVDEFQGQINNAVLRQNRDAFRQRRDLYWILTAGVYALNLVDAAVDAHLFDFNVSDNLTMHLFQPPAIQWAQAPGMQMPLARLSFKL